jgi:hypothetical protein
MRATSPIAGIEALRRAGHNIARARTDHPGAKDAAPLAQSGLILLRVHPAIRATITPWRRDPIERPSPLLIDSSGTDEEHAILLSRSPAFNRHPACERRTPPKPERSVSGAPKRPPPDRAKAP